MPLFNFKSNEKTYLINVKLYDEELEVPIEHSSKGNRLFESICASIGLRETWYFGLTYESKKYNGTLKWLKMNKRLKDLKLLKYSDNSIKMLLLIKFYPEDVSSELIQEYTQHLFYLQARQHIINEAIYCPAELCIMLASYAAQAKFGDLNETERNPGFNGALISEIPKSIVNKFQMSESLWEEKIKSCWSSHFGLVKEEAEMEYLKLASTLEMYGISYFEIKNKKGTQLWLGIDAFGLKIYPQEQKIQPEIAFKWNEIIDIVINSNKFSIKVNEARKSKNGALNKSKKISTFTFNVVDYRVNSKLILEYCIGYHELYMRRRKPETIDVQQMKQQASEIKQRRIVEKQKLEREKQMRIEAEKKRDVLEMKLVDFENQIKESQEALLKAEEAANLLNERVKLAEEETKLLFMKSSKLEAKMNIYKLLAEKKDEEKRYFEFKTAESELILTHFLDKQRSISSLNTSDYDLRSKSTLNLAIDDNLDEHKTIQFSKLSIADSLDHLENEGSMKFLREKLLSLKEELRDAHDHTKQTLSDSIYEKKFEQGDTKYSTLNKIRSGSPNARVNQFDCL